MAIHISVTKCDARAADHVVRFTRPSGSIFAYCKQSKTETGEGLGTKLMKKDFSCLVLHSGIQNEITIIL